MHQVFEITRLSRKIIAEYLEHYTLEQLNKVPEGFNNNLIWNIGHIVVVPISQAEVDEIRSLLFETFNQTKADLNSKIFKTYTEFTTLSGFTMRNVEDALAFNYYHEAMHIGMMMSIRKFI